MSEVKTEIKIYRFNKDEDVKQTQTGIPYFYNKNFTLSFFKFHQKNIFFKLKQRIQSKISVKNLICTLFLWVLSYVAINRVGRYSRTKFRNMTDN